MPSRKLISTVLALALVGGAVFYAATRKPKTETVYRTPEEESIAKAAAILAKDSDSDGLKDWEEELWKTDPKNSDTDSDKTTDGEEIRLGRDPLKPAPDDLLPAEDIATKTTLNEEKPTATDSAARRFFAQYLARKRSGVPFTADEEKKMFEDFFSSPPPLLPVATYKASELKIIKDADTGAYRAYGNALGKVINDNETDGPNEADILESASEHEDPEELAAIAGRVKRYETIIAELKDISVPEGAAAIHADLLTAFEAVRLSTQGMQYLLTDPIRALGSIGYYPHAVGLLVESFNRLAAHFEEKGVSFAKDEPGYLLIGVRN